MKSDDGERDEQRLNGSAGFGRRAYTGNESGVVIRQIKIVLRTKSTSCHGQIACAQIIGLFTKKYSVKRHNARSSPIVPG